MAKKRGGLGKGVDSIDLKEPHGLAPTVAPPPPPPPAAAKAGSSRTAAANAAAQWLDPKPGRSDDEPGVVDVSAEEIADEAPPPPPKAEAPKPPPVRKLDVSLLPWVIKKQIAGETDREDLDFRVIFSVKGYTDCLVLEGHRNDFGRVYAAQPGDMDRRYLRWSKSGFAKQAAEDALLLLKDQVEGILVESEGYSLELGSIDDLLDWCSY